MTIASELVLPSQLQQDHAAEFDAWIATVPASYLAPCKCVRDGQGAPCRHRACMPAQDESCVSVPITRMRTNLRVTRVSSHLPMSLGGYLRFSGAVEVSCAL
jgi:hypothetical protein